MIHSWIRSIALLAIASLALAPVAVAQQAAPPNDGLVPKELAASQAPAGEYWIGVQLEPLPQLITSQLKLERGMVVVQVFDDSPAAKAEFKTNDIVLRAADKDIKEPNDLIAAVNEAKDREIAVVVLRGGTETTLKVAPTRRRADRFALEVSPDTPHFRVVEALDDMIKTTDGNVRLLAVRPGGVLAYAAAAKFPDNLEVTIEKRGDHPAKIRVKRVQEGEDKTWEVTEDTIGELPEDIRGHVHSLLGGAPPGPALRLQLDQQRVARVQEQAAQARIKEAQQQTLREYRVRVRPTQPGAEYRPTPVKPSAEYRPVPVAPGAVAPPIAVVPRSDAVQEKLDAILRKLDQQQGQALQRLQAEVERLRKDLDELRQEKK